MTPATALLVALVAGCGANAADLGSRLREHPIAGVITLLNDLAEKAKDEATDEADLYNKYSMWCSDSKTGLNAAIATSKSIISERESEIESLKAAIQTTEEDISYLEKQIEKQQNEAAKAKAIREDRHDLYEGEQENFGETITAVDDAVTVLKDATPALLQDGSSSKDQRKLKAAAVLSEVHMTKAQLRGVKHFLGQGKDGPSTEHNGEILETFETMEEDFKVDKDASMEDETHAKNEYNLAKKAREEAIDAAQNVKIEKEDFLTDSKSRKGAAEGELSEQQRTLVADSVTLDDTTKDCETTRQQFVERTKTRKGELDAMKMAVEILSKVSKVRDPDEHVIAKKEFLQIASKAPFDYGMADDAMVLLQSGHRHHQRHGKHHGNRTMNLQAAEAAAVALLTQAANMTHAVHKTALGQLAAQLTTFEGPFDEIKAMIQKMVFHLMNEQKEEDEHKLWCDLEIETNSELKDDRAEKLRKYTSKINALDTEIKQLTLNIAENTGKIKTTTEYMETETKLRTNNHKEIMITLKDAQDGQVALAEATNVLTAFYKESGMIPKEPWEFIQTFSQVTRDVELPEKPETWGASYTGVTDPSSGGEGVLKLLSEVNEKFAKMEAEAKVQDVSDQENYDKDMQAMKIELTETETDTKMKTERKESLEEKMQGMTEAKKHTGVEIGAVTAYLKDLEPACSQGDSSYEDRKQARTDEIEALRKAQTLFEDAFKEA